MNDQPDKKPQDAGPPDEDQLDRMLEESFPSSDPPSHSTSAASPEEVGPPSDADRSERRREDEPKPEDPPRQ